MDLIVNLDSDLLCAADLFGRLRSDYAVVKTACAVAVTSGYTSALWPVAYGANFVFDLETYEHVSIGAC